ncbi:MAG: hypothetical protein IJ740_16395 [Ruminococcus sp.]|nr:hypothetical protein [Ruminococcus sp.]
MAFGYHFRDDYDGSLDVKMPDLLIYCTKGSQGEKYAKDNGFDIKYRKSIKSAKVTLSKTTCTYSGKEKKPAVTVKLGSKALKKGTDYVVTYKNNKKVGKATVTVSGAGVYSGNVSKTFKIIPKKSSIKTLTSPKRGQLKVTCKKVSGVTGYQITYSTSKKFTKPTTGTVTVKTTGKTIKKLDGGRTYYIKVRTYKTVDGVKYLSGYSKAEKIQIQ